MKTTITAAVLAALITTPAMAGPKPVKGGRYRCSGTVDASASIGGFVSGTSSYTINAKMGVVRQSFVLGVTTPGNRVIIAGTFPSDYNAYFDLWLSPDNSSYKGLTSGCNVASFRMSGSGTQNRNGRKVDLDFSQTYSCYGFNAVYTDRYRLACKR